MSTVIFAGDPMPWGGKWLVACLAGALLAILSGRLRGDDGLLALYYAIACAAVTALLHQLVWEDAGLFAVFVGFLVGMAVFLVAPSRTASVRVAMAVTLAALLALGLILLVQRPPKEVRVAIAQIRHSGGFVGQSDDPGTTYRDAWSVDFGVPGIDDERLLAISPHLRTLPKLWLRLSNCSVGDHGLAGLANASNLEWLNLDGTRVTDAGLIHLSQLSNLTFLDLGRTQVSDEGLRSLSQLLHLKTLLLYHTAVTENGVRDLRESLENCVIRGPGREPMQRRVGP